MTQNGEGVKYINPKALPAEIASAHEAAQKAHKSAVAHAVHAGELLLSAKARVPHGEWLAWINDNCKFTARTATGYMRLALLPHPKQQRVADLSLRQALDVLAEPRKKSISGPKREVLVEQGAGGASGHTATEAVDAFFEALVQQGGEHQPADAVHVQPVQRHQHGGADVGDDNVETRLALDEVAQLAALLLAWNVASPNTKEQFLSQSFVVNEVFRIIDSWKAAAFMPAKPAAGPG